MEKKSNDFYDSVLICQNYYVFLQAENHHSWFNERKKEHGSYCKASETIRIAGLFVQCDGIACGQQQRALATGSKDAAIYEQRRTRNLLRNH
jgi:hypothetical protein